MDDLPDKTEPESEALSPPDTRRSPTPPPRRPANTRQNEQRQAPSTAESASVSEHSRADTSLAGTGSTIALVLGIAVAVVLLALIVRDKLLNKSAAKRQRRSAKSDAEEPEDVDIRMDAATAQSEIERLAAQGRFAEAMHIILLQCLGELRAHLRISIADSLTSREILQRVQMEQRAREALSDIVRRVEVSHFGLRQPTENDFLACRNSFALVTEAGLGKGAGT